MGKMGRKGPEMAEGKAKQRNHHRDVSETHLILAQVNKLPELPEPSSSR